MGDFAKCLNETCGKKYYCYRWTLKSSTHQWYSDFRPVKIDGREECEFYIENRYATMKRKNYES